MRAQTFARYTKDQIRNGNTKIRTKERTQQRTVVIHGAAAVMKGRQQRQGKVVKEKKEAIAERMAEARSSDSL